MGVHHRKITYTLKVCISLQVLECNAVNKALTYMKSPDDTVEKPLVCLLQHIFSYTLKLTLEI